ncbi:MAG: hypothetical protein V1929_12860 [bacterium]
MRSDPGKRRLYEAAIKVKDLAPRTWVEESALFGVQDPESMVGIHQNFHQLSDSPEIVLTEAAVLEELPPVHVSGDLPPETLTRLQKLDRSGRVIEVDIAMSPSPVPACHTGAKQAFKEHFGRGSPPG